MEQAHAAQLESQTQRIHYLEIAAAAQQATLQEKTAAVSQLEVQLADARRELAARDQELTALRASASAVNGVQAQLEQLQRTVQGLASGDAAAKGG